MPLLFLQGVGALLDMLFLRTLPMFVSPIVLAPNEGRRGSEQSGPGFPSFGPEHLDHLHKAPEGRFGSYAFLAVKLLSSASSTNFS